MGCDDTISSHVPTPMPSGFRYPVHFDLLLWNTIIPDERTIRQKVPRLVHPPHIPEVCRISGPFDETWNIAREKYIEEWDAAQLVLKEAEKEFRAWEREQRNPRADGLNVVYVESPDPYFPWVLAPRAFKVNQRWIDLQTLTAPEAKEMLEHHGNISNEQWTVVKYPTSYAQMLMLRDMPKKLDVWRPRCRNYPLGHIMESLTEEERHRALSLCLEVAITASDELVQSKDLKDALIKRCRDDLRLLKKDEVRLSFSLHRCKLRQSDRDAADTQPPNAL